MKASQLLSIIRENLKDYPIDYLKNKANDDRYPDSITKRLAKYNSYIYDEIYEKDIENDFEIKDKVIENLKSDIKFYFEVNDPGDEQTRDFTVNISLYLALIAKKPLHPYTKNKKDDVYLSNGNYYCRGRIKYIKDERTLCRYCASQNPSYMNMF